MLRGFVAMAPGPAMPALKDLDQIEFIHEKGNATVDRNAALVEPDDWPLYRHDRWRSASSVTSGPDNLARLWTVNLLEELEADKELVGPIMHDWNENPVIKGPT